MNEIDLNDLAIKTDSLPDAWKMLLIDPETGLPAQNMTVARFIEFLIDKMPKTVKYNDMASINFTTEAGYGYSTVGWLYTGPIFKFGTSDGYNVHIQGDPYSNRLAMRGVYNESYKPWKTFAFLEDISNLISSPAANSLTEVSPVLESRQVAKNLPAIHLYQILLSTNQHSWTTWMVQFQLKMNHRNNTSGQSTRSAALFSNYKKKIRDLNKSSRLTA